MKKVDYRCYRCMIVESKWLLNNAKSVDYTTCSKCGGESKRISQESVSSKFSSVPYEFEKSE